MPETSPADGREGWNRYLTGYHDANPGITEDVLAAARDADGRSPYDWLVEAVPSGASTVVDLACGSGPVGRGLAPRLASGRVVGVDQSAGELARARSASPAGLLIRARAGAVPIAAGAADAVVVSMALMLLFPAEAVLAEARRLLRPGGTFAATVPNRSRSYDGKPAESAFAEVLEALGQGATDYPEPLDACRLPDRFAAAGLTLVDDETGLFVRSVSGPEDAGLVVRSFYAPGVAAARVAAAVAGLEGRMASAPVRVGYRLRRLVAVR